MGLAGQKVVQRISSDPNNLHWSNDTSKFGFRMMAKMGWAPGKGLGIKEDGSQQHIKIKLKDDNLGLGAKKNNTDNWLGNTDAFSRLLADLNSRPSTPNEEEKENDDDDNDDDDSESKDKDDKNKGKKRKSTSDEDDQEVDDKKKKKKSKKDKKEKKNKKEKKEKKDKKDKKEKKSKKEKEEVQTPAPLRNAARAKFLKAKRMATQHDPARLNEILGIKA